MVVLNRGAQSPTHRPEPAISTVSPNPQGSSQVLKLGSGGVVALLPCCQISGLVWRPMGQKVQLCTWIWHAEQHGAQCWWHRVQSQSRTVHGAPRPNPNTGGPGARSQELGRGSMRPLCPICDAGASQGHAV